jgi:hypothetical protein
VGLGGNVVQPGDVLSMEDAGKIFGYGPGSEWSSGGSPDPRLGLGQFLGSRGLTPQQYQAQYGGLPFVFNPDGTVTFDPAARKMHFHMRARPHGKNKSSPLQLLRWPLRVWLGFCLGQHPFLGVLVLLVLVVLLLVLVVLVLLVLVLVRLRVRWVNSPLPPLGRV